MINLNKTKLMHLTGSRKKEAKKEIFWPTMTRSESWSWPHGNGNYGRRKRDVKTKKDEENGEDRISLRLTWALLMSQIWPA